MPREYALNALLTCRAIEADTAANLIEGNPGPAHRQIAEGVTAGAASRLSISSRINPVQFASRAENVIKGKVTVTAQKLPQPLNHRLFIGRQQYLIHCGSAFPVKPRR